MRRPVRSAFVGIILIHAFILNCSNASDDFPIKNKTLSVCDISDKAYKITQDTATIKAILIKIMDGYFYYLSDFKCFDQWVGIVFPMSFTNDSGIQSIFDVTRPRRTYEKKPEYLIGKQIYCICTGKLNDVPGNILTLQLEKAQILLVPPAQSKK